MTTPSVTRRERLRTATVAEIKAFARRLLVAGGPPAISLRAIARDMGMTAPAIYRYFPSLDALVAELAEDLYDELRESIEAARDDAGAASRWSSCGEMARAFRRLVAGPPGRVRPDVRQPGAGRGPVRGGLRHARTTPAPGSARRSWPRSPRSGSAQPFRDRRRRAHRGAARRPPAAYRACTAPTIAVEVIYAYLSAWTRLYGLVALEVFGHMRWAVDRVGRCSRSSWPPSSPSSRPGSSARTGPRTAPTDARPLLGVAGAWGAAEIELAHRFDDLHQLVYRRGGLRPSNAAVEEVAKLS